MEMGSDAMKRVLPRGNGAKWKRGGVYRAQADRSFKHFLDDARRLLKSV
jgi:hypothetical protein